MPEALAPILDIATFIRETLLSLFETLGASPELANGLVTFIGAFLIANFVLLILVVNIWMERKVMARLQDRIGPNRVGPWGLFQTVADLGKLLSKEIIIPSQADLIPFLLAPLLAVMSVIGIWAVIPFAETAIGTDVSIGVLYFMAVSSFGIMAILMAGWSSNNKYALLGAFRAVAMLVSYEVPIILTLMVPVLLTGSMRMNEIVMAQNIWFIFMVPLAGIIFYISQVAEVGRQPFDLLEAESEIVAGYHIEYSGFAFAIFYAAEWAHGFAICALFVTLFLGGWQGPFVDQIPTLGFIYFLGKTFLVYIIQIWMRATVPRLRIDQIMDFCWKLLIPVSLALVVLIALTEGIITTLAEQGILTAPFLANYFSTATAADMLPRTFVLLTINAFITIVTLFLLARRGRAERERFEAMRQSMAPIEAGTD
ncbi:MAG: NADH-quinone oxidoreductase subunit NuoH [Chloroflexi bacterium]|nr:NADH-quinone oxidoreductase subunit NuoH [Chloroflexota bacterium]